ncbi:MAG: hypothetical protein ACFE95_04400 [Candidatus Hodarchaeota archaeon]
MSNNSSIEISKKKKQKLPRRLTIKQQFRKGIRRYFSKNYTYSRKAFIHRVQYRKMVWEKAPPLFLSLVIVLSLSIIIIDLIDLNLDSNPLLIMILLFLFCLAFVLEIWYVGGEKKRKKVGNKIRRKKREREISEIL